MAVCSRSTLPYQCHQVLHPWHTNCVSAAGMLAKPCFRESFKIYCVLYGVRYEHSQLFQYSVDECFYSDYWTDQIKKDKNLATIAATSSQFLS
jgi:hypothetical protein